MAEQAKKRRIGIMAPGRALPEGVQAQVLALAESEGFLGRLDLVFHPQCALQDGHFAGSDEARAAAFLDLAHDPSIDAVWFARGGYGSNHLLDLVIPKLTGTALDKIYMGYSDAGFLLGALHGLGIGKPVHGPMPADILRKDGEIAVKRALAWLAEPEFEDGPPRAAFNLTTLAHLAATVWMPDLLLHEVWIEDVGEYHYRFDRSLFSVMTNEKCCDISGLRLGRVSDIPENDIDFGKDEEEIVKHWCARTGVAYLGRCNIGHDIHNSVMPFRR